MELFKTETINDHITRIISITGESMFLVQGEREAALIDTGTGIGSLKEFVETLTDKPLKVIITHGHLDHAAGASAFEKVYMSSLDKDVLKACDNMADRIEYAKINLDIDVSEEMFMPISTDTLELKDGDSFELGGVTLDLYALPGHTQGSMTVLFREDRILLTGDACNTGTFLFFPECTTLEEYRDNLVTYKKRLEGKYDTIILSHGSEVLTSELLDVVIETCEAVMRGEDDKVPMEFMGQTAYGAFYVDFANGFARKDGKRGNVVYSPDRIWK